MSAMRLRSVICLALSLPLLALQGCIFSSGGNHGQQANHGYYSFINPTALSDWSLDSSYQVQWMATGAADSGMAILSLYKDDTLISGLSTYQSVAGSYLWSLSLTRTLSGYRLGSGTGYRLRVANAIDTTQWDFSPTFTIHSAYSGKLELTSPKKGAQAKLDSTLRITWTATGTVGSLVGLQLLKDTALAYSLATSTSATAGSYTVTTLYSSLGSGDDYHIRIYAYSDPSISQTGPAFTISSNYSGSFEFTSPGANDTLTAGMTAKAVWTVSGNPGDYAQITLWHDSTSIPSFSYSVSASDNSYFLNIPGGLSSGRYRLRLTSSSDAGIFAFSPAFFVRGADPDAYEKDDSLSLAKAITTDGKPQQHTLTLLDVDWVRFKAAAGKRYLAGVRVGGSVYLEAMDSASRLLKQQYGANPQLVAPAYVGTEYLRVRPYSGSAPGVYQISVLEYDSSGASTKVAFTAPDEKATWASGSYYNITWVPDSVLFGASVSLMLYNDTTFVQSIGSYVYNTGSYAWTVPSGIYSGSKYRIRMVSSLSSDLFGYSPYFTISGVTPDAYEPDNSRGAAKAITADGTVQKRNITPGDTDWVRFDAIAGKTYLASVNTSSSSTEVYLYVIDSLGNSLVSRSGSQVSATYVPSRSGTLYIRVQAYYGAGDYSLSLLAYDAGKGGLPVKFTTPDTSTVWSTGSSYLITWKPDSLTFGPQVNLDLYNDSVFVQSVTSYLGNTGSYSWILPASLYSGSKYRIRLGSYNNSALYGFSPYFTISGIVPDAYEPDNTRGLAKAIVADGAAQQRNLASNDSDWVRFDATAGKTYLATANSASASVYLYMTDSLGSTLVYQSGQRPTVAFTPTRAGKYYLRIQPYSGSGAYTLSLVSFDPAQGGVAVKFTNPDSSTVWSAGTSYIAAWTPDTAVFGTYVTLGLYQDNTLLYSLSSYNSNSGTATVSIPAGLATGKNYRVRLSSYSSSSIYGTSAPFTIAGVAPDSLEPNDSVATAKTVATNSERMPLSLSYRDKDWFRFTAHAQKMYVIEAASSTLIPTYLRVWNTAGTTTLLTNTRSTLDTLNSIAWVAPADGDYFVSVEGTSTSYFGAYGFDIKEIDPAAYKFTVSAPIAGATATAGGLLSILWSDPSSVKGYVDLFLYDADGVVATIAANASNLGSYSWSVPASLPARAICWSHRSWPRENHQPPQLEHQRRQRGFLRRAMTSAVAPAPRRHDVHLGIMPVQPPSLFLALEAPEFPAQAIAAWDDRLRGRPFAVVEQDPDSHKTYVIAVSPSARKGEVFAGMPLAAARRRLPGLEVAPRHPAWETALGDELRARGLRYTPESEVRGGRALLNLTGTPAARALRPLGLARKLLRDARYVSGLGEVYAGAAATRLMAQVMARLCAGRGEDAAVCPPGSESALLDPLPPACLPGLSPQCRARIRRYSLESVGQVRALGREALAARFGSEGDKLYTLACGLDLESSGRVAIRDPSAETVLSADGNDDDALARAVRLTADKLVFQLRARGLQADRLTLAIRYADGKAVRKTMSVRPRTDAFAALAALAHDLFRALYQRRVALRAVSLTAPAPKPDTGQTELFAGGDDRRQRALGDALAKIRARSGFGAILSGGNVGDA